MAHVKISFGNKGYINILDIQMETFGHVMLFLTISTFSPMLYCLFILIHKKVTTLYQNNLVKRFWVPRSHKEDLHLILRNSVKRFSYLTYAKALGQ